MLTDIRPFKPYDQTTGSVGVTNVSQTVNLYATGAVTRNTVAAANTTSGANFGSTSVRLVNAGTDTVFVRFAVPVATATISATGGSIPLLPNTVETFALPPDCIIFSVIGVAGGSASTLYWTTGESA